MNRLILRRMPILMRMLLASLLLGGCALERAPANLEQAGFVELTVAIPGLVSEVRYFGSDNFVGEPIAGYMAAKVYMTAAASARLARVQADLAELGLGLKVFDAYRPQRAVDHFVRWAADLDDTRMKASYYPGVDKSRLFDEGYIAARSGHSRGSTVDLTVINLADGRELDMGSPWDYFDPVSWPDSDLVTTQQRANRMLLRAVMTHHGFLPLATEWWHFTLAAEPYPDTYFDFPVR